MLVTSLEENLFHQGEEKSMALEAVVFPQDSLLGCSSIGGWPTFYEFGSGFGAEEASVDFSVDKCNENSPPLTLENEATNRPRKRRRMKSDKNREEVESQRMSHIAIERNRRKQMNEYLAVLQSLMPPSFARRGDQASIVGGAINFVKELEQLLHTLEAQRQIQKMPTSCATVTQSSPFASFFTFPQYSSSHPEIGRSDVNHPRIPTDVEATMIESHVNLKVRLRRQPKQLLKMLVGLQSLRLATLHLNVTTAANQMALCSFSLKAGDDCQFTSVDEIAAAVYEMVGRISQHENGC